MKFGVAQYGMDFWDKGKSDIETRLSRLKEIGYEGTEQFSASDPADALHKAFLYKKLGMDFRYCSGPDADATMRWTAAFGKPYVPVAADGDDFDSYCRSADRYGDACRRLGLRAALHNHLDTWVETAEQIDDFLARCPNCGLVLDTAHLALADGDPVEVVRKHVDRIDGLHIKDWLVTNPEIGRDMWIDRGRFCELGAGNIGLDNAAVLRALAEAGYDRWVFVEQDTYLRDPFKDLAVSRQFIRGAGI